MNQKARYKSVGPLRSKTTAGEAARSLGSGREARVASHHDHTVKTLISITKMELKDRVDTGVDNIMKLRDKIDRTPKGITIEYKKRADNHFVQVSSGEISPYEMTRSEKMLPDDEKE